MKKVFKPLAEIVILIAGLVLIIGGVVGWFILFKPGVEDASKTAYFQTQTAAANAALTVEPTNTVIPGQEGTSAPQAKDTGYLLDFSSYAVHAPKGSKLETPMIPDRIVIPAIGLDAPVVVADFNYTKIEGETFGQWLAPSQYAAGWQPDSALLGQVGNTVINGHHNEFGKVFEKLVDLEIGDKIYVYSKGKEFGYVVANKMKLLELTQNIETRLNNARWLAKSDDERLTLVTCWPPLSNTYRVIIVSRPMEK